MKHDARRRDAAARTTAGRARSGTPAAPSERTPFKKSTAREYFESIVIAVVLALFVRTWVVQAFKIPTGSMENNLLIGDHLLVNKFAVGPTATAAERALLPVHDIRRGDIVVFKYPEEPERDFIKRVIGLPGETLEVRDKQVLINGKALDEPYVHFLRPAGDSQEVTSFGVRDRYGPVTVPENHYFMMGDNRDNSQDSRYWGFLPAHYIKGKALMIYWSYDGETAGNADDSALKKALMVIPSFVTGTRWGRLFHQIR
jgi:signal peptidase I